MADPVAVAAAAVEIVVAVVVDNLGPAVAADTVDLVVVADTAELIAADPNNPVAVAEDVDSGPAYLACYYQRPD